MRKGGREREREREGECLMDGWMRVSCLLERRHGQLLFLPGRGLPL